jgi:hypothetical protein
MRQLKSINLCLLFFAFGATCLTGFYLHVLYEQYFFLNNYDGELCIRFSAIVLSLYVLIIIEIQIRNFCELIINIFIIIIAIIFIFISSLFSKIPYGINIALGLIFCFIPLTLTTQKYREKSFGKVLWILLKRYFICYVILYFFNIGINIVDWTLHFSEGPIFSAYCDLAYNNRNAVLDSASITQTLGRTNEMTHFKIRYYPGLIESEVITVIVYHGDWYAKIDLYKLFRFKAIYRGTLMSLFPNHAELYDPEKVYFAREARYTLNKAQKNGESLPLILATPNWKKPRYYDGNSDFIYWIVVSQDHSGKKE